MIVNTRWTKKGFRLEIIKNEKTYTRVRKTPTACIEAVERYHLLSPHDKRTIIRIYGR
jgi:hypothetical protein